MDRVIARDEIAKQGPSILDNSTSKFLGKLSLGIGVYQKAPPVGGSFGEVSESLHLLRSARL